MKHNPFYYLIHIDRTIKVLLCRISPSYAFKQDRKAIERMWKQFMDYPLDLDNPKTFCEKVQWMKLYNRNPLYHTLVDKYEVKKWVASKIGAEHVVKSYGVWDSIEDIDFSKLPQKFVLKCTHTSGGMAFVKDKSSLEIEKIKKSIEPFLRIPSWYPFYKEWAYKDVPPRILAEEYIESLGSLDSTEYKITCANGKARMIRVCSGIGHGNSSEWFIDCYQTDGKKIPFSLRPCSEDEWYVSNGKELPSKPILDELIRIAEVLSEGIPQVRVDLYVHNGIVMFGEMTFYTFGGFVDIKPKEMDRVMGDWIDLKQE